MTDKTNSKNKDKKEKETSEREKEKDKEREKEKGKKEEKKEIEEKAEEKEEEASEEGEIVTKFPEESFNFQLETTTAHEKAAMVIESKERAPQFNLEGFVQGAETGEKTEKKKEKKPVDFYSPTSGGYLSERAQEDSWEKQQLKEVKEIIKPTLTLHEPRRLAAKAEWKPAGELEDIKEFTKYETKYEKIGEGIKGPGFGREDKEKQNIKKYKAIRA